MPLFHARLFIPVLACAGAIGESDCVFIKGEKKMTKTRSLAALFGCSVIVLLAGCGGGGGDGGAATTVVSATAFPLQTGYRARVAAGASDNFTISGTCAGTAQITNGAATASVFEGVSGFAAAQTATVNFTNCTPSSSTASGTNYYDANYTPIGTSVLALEYAKFLTAPTVLSASARVGDTAVYATLTTYTDSTKSTTTGQRVLSYAIEADTANTVIVDFTTKTYDTTPQLLLTQQTRYRVAVDGTLTLLSIDIQYSGTSGTAHLLYTKV